jgi:hypothetical protein
MEGVINTFFITLEYPGSKSIVFERATGAHEPHKENEA